MDWFTQLERGGSRPQCFIRSFFIYIVPQAQR